MYTVVIPNERVMAVYKIQRVMEHIHVYDENGNFLFSADSEREVREELREYAKSAA